MLGVTVTAAAYAVSQGWRIVANFWNVPSGLPVQASASSVVRLHIPTEERIHAIDTPPQAPTYALPLSLCVHVALAASCAGGRGSRQVDNRTRSHTRITWAAKGWDSLACTRRRAWLTCTSRTFTPTTAVPEVRGKLTGAIVAIGHHHARFRFAWASGLCSISTEKESRAASEAWS